MTAETRSCGMCQGTMQFRLGEYECACGNRERPQPVDPRQREFAPPQLIEAREAAAVAVKTAYATPQAELQTLRSTRDYRKLAPEKDRYDPSPGIEREKMILFAIYAGRVVLTVSLALAAGKDFSEGGWLIKDGVGLLLIATALFTPITIIKMIAAYLSGLMGGLGLLGTLFSLFAMGIVGGAVAPGWYGFLGYVGGTIISVAAAVVELWLASTLFRDAHRIQVMRS